MDKKHDRRHKYNSTECYNHECDNLLPSAPCTKQYKNKDSPRNKALIIQGAAYKYSPTEVLAAYLKSSCYPAILINMSRGFIMY